ncbi:response regulator [Verrucomicrobiaceae bacterium R5-34]|uniref:Response regulator n=1 Tax=Oceaniferula flava TaxID=2800421 RepID=A0AAE2SFT8_9BACT|nr:response regulator [Oceaniferula flavus]MBK1831045.1 response regulator [Verrucomicrobiaceae bacterium R5-34]MBK1855561.1 response regulator [Oceaniferula flavus]MBM1136867.1 response regulator [Oceaniferula flavus]
MNPILVVNDDSSLLADITKILKEGGYFHIAASSGQQALTMASGYDFPLAILDLKLADMDGDELYQKLLKSESHYTLPVVALVDSLDAEEVAVVNRLLPQGQVTLLSKPLKREWLEDLFERYGEKKS